MSWVAELNAINQKIANVHWKKCSVGTVKAIPANPAPISNCMVVVHQRLVFIKSMNGLHNGLMTQGKFSQPV